MQLLEYHLIVPISFRNDRERLNKEIKSWQEKRFSFLRQEPDQVQVQEEGCSEGKCFEKKASDWISSKASGFPTVPAMLITAALNHLGTDSLPEHFRNEAYVLQS